MTDEDYKFLWPKYVYLILNDDELGAIVEFALQQLCVRGVAFQPVQQAGRREAFDPAKHRLTLTEVRRRILSQTSVFSPRILFRFPVIRIRWRWLMP